MRTEPRGEMPPAELLVELNALARAISGDPQARIEVGAPGSGWFVSRATKVVNADLKQWCSEDDLRGLVVHEAGHLYLSFYHDFRHPTAQQEAFAWLLNCLEDARLEQYLATAFPGTRAWLEGHNRRLLTSAITAESHFMALLQAIAVRTALGVRREPTGLPREVRAVLAQVDEDVQAYVFETQPTPAEAVGPADLVAYEAAAVSSYYSDRPGPLLAMLRLRSHQAFLIARRIFAAAQHLIAQDEAHGRAVCPSDPPPGQGSPARPQRGHSRRVRSALRRAMTESEPEHLDPWTDPPAEIEHLTVQLVRRLEAVLPPRDMPRWDGPWEHGDRPDLRSAMQAEADPAGRTAVWQRRGEPVERSQRFYALVDLSGSMSREEKIARAMCGVRVFLEALDCLGFDAAVYGFQDVLIPFRRLGQPLAEARPVLAEMGLEVFSRRPGGHNRHDSNHDGPVLEAMLDQIRADGSDLAETVLLILSDGAPSGPGGEDGGTLALHRAVAKLSATPLVLVSLGLGPGTDHVTRYYGDRGRACVPVEQIPEVIAGMVHEQVRRATRPH